MNEIHFFLKDQFPEVHAALPGINRYDWVYTSKRENIEIAFQIMSSNRFDILPIKERDGDYLRYFKTKEWGKFGNKEIIKCDILAEDRIYFLTRIRDVIREFAEKNRNFFFLDNNKEILGLITIGNLNSKHVYLYLYNLILQLENHMGSALYSAGFNDRELTSVFQKLNNSRRVSEVLNRFERDQARGADFRFVEYLYLSDYKNIYEDIEIKEKLKISCSEFPNVLVNINKIRNVVAHPNKSLIRNENSIKELSRAIDALEELTIEFRELERNHKRTKYKQKSRLL